MWFGTGEGLNKFDGSSFTLYENNINDTNSLIGNNINAILEDVNHNLWIGTANGLCIYNREKESFKAFRNFGRKQFISVTSLFQDINSNIWIGTAGFGLFLYDVQNDTLYSYMQDNKDNASISSNFIFEIVSDKKNRIWIGTRNGLDIYNSKKNAFAHFNDFQGLSDNVNISYVKGLCIDKEGNLWVGTYGSGLYKLTEHNNRWQVQHFLASDKPGNLSKNDILSLICDEKNNLWIGTENGGLNILPVHSKEFTVYQAEDGNIHGISSNSIWSLYQDKTGIIWIGTYNNGLNFTDERIEKFEVYQRNPYEHKKLVNNNVFNFTEDKTGNIWIATDGGGISSFDPQTRRFTNKIDNVSISSKAVMAVLCDSRERIWVGTWGGGIDLFDISGRKIKNFKLEAYNRPGNILSFFEDKNGNIWAGTAGNGLLVYNPVINDFSKIIDKSSRTHLSKNAIINIVFQDSENTFWIGIPYSLISMKNINGKTVFTEYRPSSDPTNLSSSGIITVFEDSRHNIWIGTDDGLNLLNKENGTFTIYRKENGLPNNFINGILEDQNNCLWISSYYGISKFDIEHKTFKNYSKDDGLLSNSFNPRSCLKTRSGEFFFGSNTGFVVFFPDSIKANTFIPPVYFTGLKIFNNPVAIGAKDSPLSKNISDTRQITLNYKQTSFTIEFVALNFTHAAKNQYEYMLEGFDKSWNYAGTKRFASYTNIIAGKYIFKVRGSNNEGIWNPNPIQLEIIVLPPYWKTKWAYLLYTICISFILWGFIRLLIIKSNQAEKLRLEQIHHEQSEELNKMKIQFFANISHEFRTPLSLILPPLKQIIDREPLKSDVKKRMEMVFRNASRLFGLVNELMDFTKSEEGLLKMMVQEVDIVLFSREIHNMFVEEARRRDINYRFEPEFDSIEAWVDKSKMEKIISNLLSNAFKFTPDRGYIIFKIGKETENDHSYITISIVDNGSGIAQEYINKVFDRFFQSPEEENKHIAGTGIGLALVRSLVELHHGKVSVTSQKWKETCFTIRIPLGNAHFNKNVILGDPGENFLTLNAPVKLEQKDKSLKPEGNVPLLLIVEDNFELREYLVSILSQNYQVLEAADGVEGLKIAQESIPDLILSDIVMPRLSGTELCKTIKNEMPTSHIPVILLTSKATTSEIIEGIGTGADAYITKPFDILHLEVTIEKTIETRRKLYQRFSQDVYIIPNENAENELDKKFLESIIVYIDKNVSNDNISVENLAGHLLMSRTNVYRKIKALTGQTATEFIRLVRLKMAIKLLETGQYNISEIAFKIGFTSPGYFAKCFKDQYGKSPSEFVFAKSKKV